MSFIFVEKASSFFYTVGAFIQS
jgi:hypothetical protein